MDSSPYAPSIHKDEPATPKHYDAFISYSRKNEDFAAKLEQALESYRPPKGFGAPQRRLSVFRDKHDFKVGDYHQNLEHSLMASAKLIIICSPEARRSQFVNDEIRKFAALNDSKDIIPVLHSGIPNNEAGPEQAESMAFPPALCEPMEMPLAANFLKFDSQKGKINRDPYSDAWYTILAHIYDVSRDEIEQRDRKRRKRTRQLVLASLTGAIVVLSSLLVITFISRQQADAARKDAVNQAKEATKQRGIAEGKTREAKRERDNALKAQQAEKQQRQEADRQRTNAERQTLIATAQKNKAVLAQAAETRQRKTAQHQTKLALLREQIALVSGLLPTVEAVEGMIRAIALFPASQEKAVAKEVAIAGQTALLNAVQMSQESNRIQDINIVQSVAFSPDGRHIVSDSGDNTLRLWNAFTGQPIGSPLQGHTRQVTFVAFSPDGRRIASGSGDNTLRFWDAATGKPIGSPLQGNFGEPVALSPDGRLILAPTFRNTLRLWDAATGKPIGSPLEGQTNSVYSAAVAFSPDGRRLVSSSDDNTLRLWDAATGQLIGSPLKGHTNGVYSIAFSPDGRRLVSGSLDNTVRLWDVAIGQPIGSPLQGHTRSVESVAFSPDGRRVVSGSIDNTLRLLDAATGKLIGSPLQGHTSEVSAVAFSPDGRRIVSGSDDNTLRLWDAATGKPIGSPLQGHTSGVSAVAFSPDGRRIVSCSGDNTLRLWDAATGKPIGEPLKGHTKAVNSVAFSPDGRLIVSGSGDNTLRLWKVDPQAWLAIACGRIGQHRMLQEPQAFSSDKEFQRVAVQARQVCAHRQQHSTHAARPGLRSWLAGLRKTIKNSLASARRP
jgi:WD40 repeat protein